MTTPAMQRAIDGGWSAWIRTEADARAVEAGCTFDLKAAERVFGFFHKFLRHSKGNQWAGKPFDLLPWQRDYVVGPLFGWKRADGLRRFRRAHIEVPKKQGKSTVAAGVGLYLLVADGEAGAEVYSAATKREQAAIVHNEAVTMVKSSPMLSRRLSLNKTSGTIVYEATFSKYQILAHDAGGSEGLNIHGLIADELHVWKGRAFWDSLRWGSASRTQPLFFVITTAGIYDRTSIGYQEHEYALNVQDGKTEDDQLYVYIRAADKDDDPMAEATWLKANPSLGSIMTVSDFAQEAKIAHQKHTEWGPFLRYRLNIWSENADSFFDMEKWRACNGEFNESELVGRRCYAGLDLASKRDVAAWVLLFPPDEDDKWRVLPRFYVPKNTAEARESQDGVKYATWGGEGYITLTEGDTIDYETILADISSDYRKFDIASVGADKWNLEFMRQQLLDSAPDMEVVEFAQTLRDMSEPTKMLETLVIDGLLAHGGNPVLEWMAGNSTIITDGNKNVKISKGESRDKVDGIIALVMALGRSMVPVADTTPGVYAL